MIENIATTLERAIADIGRKVDKHLEAMEREVRGSVIDAPSSLPLVRRN